MKRGKFLSLSAVSVILKFAQAILSFMLAVILARTLEPSGYGAYSFAIAFMYILAIPVQAGLPQLIVRQTAIYQSKNEGALLRAFWRWANNYVLVFSTIVVFAWFAASQLLSQSPHSHAIKLISIAVFIIIPLSLATVRASALRGLRHLVSGQVPEKIINPSLFLFFVVALNHYLPEIIQSRAAVALGLNLASSTLTYFFGAYILMQVGKQIFRLKPNYSPPRVEWFKSLLPLSLLGGLQVVSTNFDILLVTYFLNTTEAGIYKVALQLSLVVLFITRSFDLVVQPYIANFFLNKKFNELQFIARLAAAAVFTASLAAFITIYFLGQIIIIEAFGPEYEAAYFPAVILIAGYLINSSFGPAVQVLTMTGHETACVTAFLFSTALHGALLAAVVPHYGLPGASLAMSISIIVRSFILFYYVRKHLRFSIDIFAGFCARYSSGWRKL